MSRKGNVALWIASLTALFIVAPKVSAEEISYSILMQRLESLEQQLAERDAQFASYSLGGGVQKDDACASCQKGKGDCGCEAPAWYAAYEMTILQPYVGDFFVGPGFDDDYGVGHRFTLGRDGGNGMGVRGRYWFYNHGKGGVGALAGGNVHIDMDVVDLEATLDGDFCNWDLMVSGGLRYGRAGLTPDGAIVGAALTYEGLGPTFSFEATRDIGDRGLYVVGNFRGSLLFGEVDGNGGMSLFDDELATVWENQLGLGWRRELARADLNVRAVWESQFWLNETISEISGSHLGFTGPTFSAELRY